MAQRWKLNYGYLILLPSTTFLSLFPFSLCFSFFFFPPSSYLYRPLSIFCLSRSFAFVSIGRDIDILAFFLQAKIRPSHLCHLPSKSFFIFMTSVFLSNLYESSSFSSIFPKRFPCSLILSQDLSMFAWNARKSYLIWNNYKTFFLYIQKKKKCFSTPSRSEFISTMSFHDHTIFVFTISSYISLSLEKNEKHRRRKNRTEMIFRL